MSSLVRVIARSAPGMHSAAIFALIGATVLATPLTAARAQTSAPMPAQPPQAASMPSSGAAEAASSKPETLDDRISSLHAALQITPDEEKKWSEVAQTMRDNAAKMEKMSSEKAAKDPQSLTAVDDLKTYEKFARAHVDGLKKLISSFEALYKSMPDQQKKVADQVFQSFGRTPSHG